MKEKKIKPGDMPDDELLGIEVDGYYLDEFVNAKEYADKLLEALAMPIIDADILASMPEVIGLDEISEFDAEFWK